MTPQKENIILLRTKAFSLEIIKLYKVLQSEKEYVISNQLLKSATSIGANVWEANAGQSKRDFFAKICIAYKEAHESMYWLELLDESDLTKQDVTKYMGDCKEIIRILSQIKISTEKSMK